MKKIIFASVALSVVLATSACTENSKSPTNLPPGSYKSSSSSTDASGTDVKTTKTTEVGYDANGNKTAVVKTEKTTDPKGLMNKKKTKTKTVIKAKP